MIAIAVVCGGDSGEYEVSLNSAEMVLQTLDPAIFKPYKLLIKGNDWHVEEKGKNYPVDKNDFSVTIGKKIIRFECAYLIIHGTPGEDGKLQGYLELIGIPYTSPNVLVSSITMNKYLSKKICKSEKIPVAKAFLARSYDEMIDVDHFAGKLGLPCFVKPNNGGSSVATFKVRTKEEMVDAIEAGFEHDEEVIIEEFLKGRELTIGVYRSAEGILTLPVTEVVSHNEFFDYDAKYNGQSDEITPARIDKKLEMKVRKLAAKVYDLFNIHALVRIDFIVHKDKPYFMEINTVPGFSQASIVPQQIRAAGLSERETLTELISLAMQRKA